MGIQRRNKIYGGWAIIIGCFVLHFLHPQARAETWRLQDVDAPKQFSALTTRSIAVDTNGNPHIAYGQDHLYHAYYDGSTWYNEVVDSSPKVDCASSMDWRAVFSDNSN